ncbi:MAG: hypothetical protein LKJ17_09400 [Oscillospiraceae bacterium]|jgi:hypothetical protein|nr:hypothetical protein [Oscillospiraceae bacterium]
MQDTSFHNITIDLQEHCVNITTNPELMSFLAQPDNGSVKLARYTRSQYETIFHKPLKISEASLAVEILIHAYLDRISLNALAIQKLFPEKISKPILALINKVHERTAVINCGETSVDSNRFVFDDLAPFHTLIFAALGKLA